MRVNLKIIRKYLVPVLFVLVIAFSFNLVSAQDSSDSAMVKFSPPVQERFVESTGLVMPWLASGCNYVRAYNVPDCRFLFPVSTACETEKFYGGETLRKIQNCYYISPEERKSKEFTELYKNDGSLWFRFSNDNKSPEHFDVSNEKPEFKPFSYNGFYAYLYGAAVLRLVSESPNWYEVEINEETRETKFIWKKDSNWTKISWDYWLGKIYDFNLVNQPLRDKPNGKIIEESANLNFIYFTYLNRTDGDWVFVKGERKKDNNSKEYKGWIRWRNGRYILFVRPKFSGVH